MSNWLLSAQMTSCAGRTPGMRGTAGKRLGGNSPAIRKGIMFILLGFCQQPIWADLSARHRQQPLGLGTFTFGGFENHAIDFEIDFANRQIDARTVVNDSEFSTSFALGFSEGGSVNGDGASLFNT